MNISLLSFLLCLLFLTVPFYVFWRLDSRLFRQSAVVVGRMAGVLLILAVCYVYLFRWNLAWLNVLWVLLSGGVAVRFFCRQRWLWVPVYAGMMGASLLTGLLVLLLAGAPRLFDAWLFIPVMSVLQADALFVGRSGLVHYVLNMRRHGSLQEYLLGNGATAREAQRPFVALAMKRALVPALTMMAQVGVVFVPSLLVGLLLGGVAPLQAMAWMALLTAGGLCCSVASLLVAIALYVRLKKELTDVRK